MQSRPEKQETSFINFATNNSWQPISISIDSEKMFTFEWLGEEITVGGYLLSEMGTNFVISNCRKF